MEWYALLEDVPSLKNGNELVVHVEYPTVWRRKQ